MAKIKQYLGPWHGMLDQICPSGKTNWGTQGAEFKVMLKGREYSSLGKCNCLYISIFDIGQLYSFCLSQFVYFYLNFTHCALTC